MAVKVMTPQKGAVNKITKFTAETATSAADGFEFKLPRASDEYVIVIFQNTSATAYDVSIKAPIKGSYAASTSDETLKLGANETAFFRLESARWAENDGTVRIVPENVAVLAAVIY